MENEATEALSRIAVCGNCKHLRQANLFDSVCLRLGGRGVSTGMACECFEGNSLAIQSQLAETVKAINSAEALPPGLYQDEEGSVWEEQIGGLDTVMERCEKCGEYCLPDEITELGCLCDDCLSIAHPSPPLKCRVIGKAG